MVESVDTADLKSAGFLLVRVQVPPAAPVSRVVNDGYLNRIFDAKVFRRRGLDEMLIPIN